MAIKINGLFRIEEKVFRQMNGPDKIQRFLDEILGYDDDPHVSTCRSPRRVLRDGKAQCMDGAIFAAAALHFHGHPPLLVDLEAVRDDDHVLAAYRRRGYWGAIAKSNYSGLRFREPVYRSIRELVMSYFEHYFNLAGEKTLRNYSRPVNLKRFDHLEWVTTEEDLWAIPEHLHKIPHAPVLRPGMERALARMDRRLFAAGCYGTVGLPAQVRRRLKLRPGPGA